MPDISMCNGGDCPLKEMCYRYTAKPSEYAQSYFETPPINDGKCDHFMQDWSKQKPEFVGLSIIKKQA